MSLASLQRVNAEERSCGKQQAYVTKVSIFAETAGTVSIVIQPSSEPYSQVGVSKGVVRVAR